MDDTSMQSSNVSPIMEYLEDCVGSTQDASELLFNIYAPMIHWYATPSTTEYELI